MIIFNINYKKINNQKMKEKTKMMKLITVKLNKKMRKTMKKRKKKKPLFNRLIVFLNKKFKRKKKGGKIK